MDDYRRIRSEIERSVLPLATSVDGREFAFQASLHQLQLQTGGYVVLEDEGGDRRLGQVLTVRPESALAPRSWAGGRELQHADPLCAG